MNLLIGNNRQAITELCHRHDVCTLETFGSVLCDDFNAGRRNVDILVQFQPEVNKSFRNFLGLKEALEELFQRPVDLIEPQAIRNRRLRYYIDQSRAPIYDTA